MTCRCVRVYFLKVFTTCFLEFQPCQWDYYPSLKACQMYDAPFRYKVVTSLPLSGLKSRKTLYIYKDVSLLNKHRRSFSLQCSSYTSSPSPTACVVTTRCWPELKSNNLARIYITISMTGSCFLFTQRTLTHHSFWYVFRDLRRGTIICAVSLQILF